MTKSLASIYWEACHAERPLYGGVFDLPPVKRGDKPAILEIRDHVQMEKRPHIMGGGQTPTTIFGEEIAPCVLKEWASNALGMTPECGPGIWVVRDVIPLLNHDGTPVIDSATKKAQFRPATDEERATMWAEDLQNAIARQEKWAEYLIQQGDIWAQDPEGKKIILIQPIHRRACIHYGREREWLHELKDGDRRACQFCGASLAATVVKCNKCGEIVDRERYAQLTKGTPLPPPIKTPGKDHVAA